MRRRRRKRCTRLQAQAGDVAVFWDLNSSLGDAKKKPGVRLFQEVAKETVEERGRGRWKHKL